MQAVKERRHSLEAAVTGWTGIRSEQERTETRRLSPGPPSPPQGDLWDEAEAREISGPEATPQGDVYSQEPTSLL